jgi:hypothetical protein
VFPLLLLQLLADAPTSPVSDPVALLLTYGPLGVVFVLSITGLIRFRPEVDDLRRQRDEAVAQRDALIETYQEKVIPVLGQVAQDVLPALIEAKRSGDNATRAFTSMREEFLRSNGRGD